MRLAIVVDAYAPARTSAAVQIRDLAHELIARGERPTVIVPSPDLRGPWSREHVDGVEVLRLRAPRTKDLGHARRALAEAALPIAMLHNLRRSPLGDARWDGVVWYSPTIFFGPLIAWLKSRSRCRSYLILRDLFPDWAVDAGVMRRGLVYRGLKAVEHFQYSVADVIGVQTPANLVHLARHRRSRRVEVLHNWLADAAVRRPSVAPGGERLAGRTLFVYAGNMGVAQGMDCMIELARRLQPRRDVGFVFVGRGSDVPRLRRMADDLALDNVVFHDEIEPDDVPGFLAQCQIGLLALDPRHRTHNIPGKFLTYLRAGLPVLARINPGNDLESLIDQRGVGRVCAGDDADRLHAFARELVDDPETRQRMGLRGRALAAEMFSVEVAASQLVAGLDAAVRAAPPRTQEVP